MLWIVLALMTGAAVLCVVWPLSKPRPAAARLVGDDVAFYRDQMRVLEREVSNGLVPAAEAEASRAEVGRRLIAAHNRSLEPGETRAIANPRRLFAIASAVIVFVPAVSLATYLHTGKPEQEDMPLASRQSAPSSNGIAEAIARVESHLASHPEDGRGFEVLAPLYLRLARYDEAAHAFDRTLALLGETASRRAGYGQALMMAADGVVTTDAQRAFEQANQDDPSAPEPRFYLGLAAAEGGDKTKARVIWTDLAAGAPADAPWLPVLKARLSALDNPAAPVEGPATPAGAAVAALPPEQRMAMIHTMVDSLATRLANNGHDKEGWLKLVRAYAVLGEKDHASTALADGRRNFAGDPQALGELDGLAHELGLES